MESSGPWASYTYNGLPASQAPPPGSLGSSSAGQRTVADLQAMGNPQAAASQLLLAGMSPAAVAVAANSSFQLGNYDSTVFSSLFHHQKQQHRSHQVVGQGGQMEQSSPWTPQTNSLGNPFGVLPHQASQKTNPSPSKGENTFSAHLIPPFAHSASSYGNAGAPAAPNLPFVPQKTAPKVPIFTPKAPPKHKAAPLETRYNPMPSAPPGISAAAAAAAAASAVINNAKPANIIVHRSFPPHLQPQCRSYPSPDSDYQQHRNTPDSVSSGPYGDSDCHMSMERPSPNPSSPYYNMASPESCVYSKHDRQPPPQQQQQQQPPVPPQQQFPMKPHNSWDEKRSVVPPGRYNYSESENNNAFHVSDQQHYQSTINLSDLHGGSGGGGDELLAHGGSDSEDYERNKRQRRNKRARKSDSPEKINRQLTLLQPVHAEDGYAAAALGFHSRVAFPPLPQLQPGVHQQHPQQHHQHAHHQEHQHQQQNNYQPQEQQQQQQSKETRSLIDEELGFLEMDTANKKGTPTKPAITLKKDQPAFMDSFIKFLTGDQDNSLCTTSVRSGRKSPLRQRARTLPQKCPETPPQQLQQQQQAAQQHQQHQQPQLQQQPQQQQQQQQHHGYQIHQQQQQQLEPPSHREDGMEQSGRGRKRSLPVEGQTEGVSIAGLAEQNALNDNEHVPDVTLDHDDNDDEEIDYTQKQFQPFVVITRMSPRTLRKYSHSDDSNTSSDVSAPEPAESQVEPEKAFENSGPANVKGNLETISDLMPANLTFGGLELGFPSGSMSQQAMKSLQDIFNFDRSLPLMLNVEKHCSTEENGPSLSLECMMLPELSKDPVSAPLEILTPLTKVFNASMNQCIKSEIKNDDTPCAAVTLDECNLQVESDISLDEPTDENSNQENDKPFENAQPPSAHYEENNKERKERCKSASFFDLDREDREILHESDLPLSEVLDIIKERSESRTRAKIGMKRHSAPDDFGPALKKQSLKNRKNQNIPPIATSIDEEMADLLGNSVVERFHKYCMNLVTPIWKKPQNKARVASVKKDGLSVTSTGKKAQKPKAKVVVQVVKKNKPPPVQNVEVDDSLMPELKPSARRRRYKTGTFMMDVSEMIFPDAKLYRVDGPELKQVFETFTLNGEKLYKSTPTYSNWNLDEYRKFKVFDVEYYQQAKHMTIVRLLLPESPQKTRKGAQTKSAIAKRENELHFKTYIQALISQTLDDGFLLAAKEEKVKYFTSSISIIDELNDQRITQLLKHYKIPKEIYDILMLWPQLTCKTLCVTNMCQCCNEKTALYLITGDGNPYCKKTLLFYDLGQNILAKEFTACRKCCVQVYHFRKYAHLKLDLFELCRSRMSSNPVADRVLVHVHSKWFDKLFKDLQQMWATADCMSMTKEP